jgi:hypothetical protein
MLGSLRVGVQEAMKELHALGKRLENGTRSGTLDPQMGVEILKESVREMLRKQNIPLESMMDDQRFASSNCKV